MSEQKKHVVGEYLATNLKYLRSQSGLTQTQLARRAGIPRSTVATFETGSGNPTLAVLIAIANGLQIRMDELLSAPRARIAYFPKGVLQRQDRARGRAEVVKLLPEPIPGMEIDRMRLKPGARMVGVPHRSGTREYLNCERGEITLWAAGEKITLKAGDVVAFQGDKRHSYTNDGDVEAVGFSVVTFAPNHLGA